jgi:hypothetical protein
LPRQAKLDFTLIEGVAPPAIMPNMAQIDILSTYNYPTQINAPATRAAPLAA